MNLIPNKSLIIFLLIVFSQILQAQNPYYDAILLGKYSKISGDKVSLNAAQPDVYNTLAKYFPSANNYDDIDLSGNPFMKFGSEPHSDDDLDKKGFSLKSIGGLNVTNLADGLAKFLVERTKQELSLAFFDKFKTELKNVPELRLLFPNTKKVLDAIDQEIYMYANYLNSLREAFKKDLDNILVSLENYVTTQYTDKHEIVEPLSGALFFANQIKNGIHPASAAGDLANRKPNVSTYKADEYKKFIYGLRIFDIISQSLQSRDDNRYWVSSDSLKYLLDETTFRIYAGLLYQQHESVKIGDSSTSTFGAQLRGMKNTIDVLKDPIEKFISKAENLSTEINSLKNKKSSGQKIDSYFNVFNSSVSLIGESKDMASSFGLTIQTDSLDKYLYIARLIGEIHSDVSERKYNALIIDIIELADTLNIGSGNFQKKFLKYGTFVANVAQAESSDDVQSAIEAIAMPVGSASVKRKAQFNISLNAYLGLSGGQEILDDAPSGLDERSFNFGLIAPIGPALSWGLGKKKEAGSLSLFMSVIDVGALASFRFQEEEITIMENNTPMDVEADVSTVPELELQNILAPGGYIIYGIPNWPLSIGGGAQLGPGLRKINIEGNVAEPVIESSAWRWHVFIAVDIPLINFYTKSR